MLRRRVPTVGSKLLYTIAFTCLNSTPHAWANRCHQPARYLHVQIHSKSWQVLVSMSYWQAKAPVTLALQARLFWLLQNSIANCQDNQASQWDNYKHAPNLEPSPGAGIYTVLWKICTGTMKHILSPTIDKKICGGFKATLTCSGTNHPVGSLPTSCAWPFGTLQK